MKTQPVSRSDFCIGSYIKNQIEDELKNIQGEHFDKNDIIAVISKFLIDSVYKKSILLSDLQFTYYAPINVNLE